MKKVFKQAHKMTREMVEKYGVDYQTQFGLNLAYLLENKEEVEMNGSEKQVKWAEAIREGLVAGFEKFVEDMHKKIEGHEKAERIKNELLPDGERFLNEIKFNLENETSAKFFIENFSDFANLRPSIHRGIAKEHNLESASTLFKWKLDEMAQTYNLELPQLIKWLKK